ncbi:restriction endonuclease [Chloroflexota bacterium]
MVKIRVNDFHEHSKASERYVSVVFEYDDGEVWEGWVPIEYRRTGTNLLTEDEIEAHLEAVAPFFHPSRFGEWRKEQDSFWRTKPRAQVTKPFYDVLQKFEWSCTGCAFPPNTNPARRYQDLKEFGYTLATDKNRTCTNCGRVGTHILMVPLPRGGISGYESWSPALRTRIIKVLGSIDVYEGKRVNPTSLIPDHKFPEIRWDETTRRDSLEHLTDSEIRDEFQLLTNQRNLQKREVCRTCYQTGKRGFPFGLKYFYSGDENWPKDIPLQGKLAQRGCIGCGWYDLSLWRTSLLSIVDKSTVQRS